VNDNVPTLRDQAHAAIVTVITASGRRIPVALEDTAVELLSELWTADLTHGVEPQDWQAACSLPTACLDVQTLVEARRRNNPDTEPKSDLRAGALVMLESPYRTSRRVRQ
jgi:hypothetical protein